MKQASDPSWTGGAAHGAITKSDSHSGSWGGRGTRMWACKWLQTWAHTCTFTPLFRTVTAAVKKETRRLRGPMAAGARSSRQTEASSSGSVGRSGQRDGLLLRAAVIRQMERMRHHAHSQMLEVLSAAVLDAEHSGYDVQTSRNFFLLELLTARPVNKMFKIRSMRPNYGELEHSSQHRAQDGSYSQPPS